MYYTYEDAVSLAIAFVENQPGTDLETLISEIWGRMQEEMR